MISGRFCEKCYGPIIEHTGVFDLMIWLYYFDIACLQEDLSQDDECLLIEPEVQGSSQLNNGLFKLFQVHVADTKIVRNLPIFLLLWSCNEHVNQNVN